MTAAFGPAAHFSPARAQTASPRPNIVFILTDDLDTSSMDYLPGLKVLLADRGTTFTRFFVSDSLCCPSRSSILCGEYNHNHHVLTNALPDGGYEKFLALGHEETTVAVRLHHAGYRTVLMGKYLNGYPAGSGPTWVPPGWDEWYAPVDGTPYAEFNYMLNENGRLVGHGNAPGDYLVDVLAARAQSFIERTTASSKPFFMYIAPYAPHAPFTPPPRYADAFPGAQAPRPPSFDEADVADKPAWVRSLPLLSQTDIDQIDTFWRRRLQSMLAVQDLVAAVIASLQRAGKLDNTYIFFTSDNGYHLGEHRLIAGKQTPYEEDLRVPLVVRGPGVPSGAVLTHLVGNIDFASTFLDLAGAPLNADLDGRSMVPLLGQSPPPVDVWRQAFLLEHTEQGPSQRSGSSSRHRAPSGTLEPPDAQAPLLNPRDHEPAIPNFEGIRLQNSVYIEYEDGEREYYDLSADPWQLSNLAGTADPGLLQGLSSWLGVLRRCSAAGCRTADASPP